MTLFRIAIRDEIFDNGALVESRVSHGEARQDGRTIVATDRAAADLVPPPLRVTVPGARTRVVTRATDETLETTITVTRDGLSIVTTPEYLDTDVRMLDPRPATRDPRPATPLVWRNGSGAVLLHEVLGHPLEHGEASDLPDWLHADISLAERRESFRDVPLLRMTSVNVTQTNAPFDAPGDAVNVYLLAGGGYDPLTSLVTIHVVVSDAGPFEIVATRERVIASLLGARGEPERYPGVICSREGQQLYVGSYAPVILTAGLT